jgi:hypothetical protein
MDRSRVVTMLAESFHDNTKIMDVFEYYIRDLSKHDDVIAFVTEQGYENLHAMLDNIKKETDQ